MPETGPETEVISCPACRHLLRVPLDWLGEQVQCPECQAKFLAPVRDASGSLTGAELISRPPAEAPPPRRMDAMLLLPAFGLMVCGIAGAIVNGILAYKFATDPVGSKEYLKGQFTKMRQFGVGSEDPEADRDRLDTDRAEETFHLLRWVVPTFAGVSALVLLGGLSIALRWNYRIGQLGCIAAALNFAHLCCIPGSIVGVWGLFMLGSEEGRAHFGRR